MRPALSEQSPPYAYTFHLCVATPVDEDTRICIDLTEPVDIYAEWQDAADEAEKNARYEQRPAQASASRARPAARRSPGVDFGSDDE